MSTESAPDCFRSLESLAIIHDASNGNEAAEAFLHKLLDAMEVVDDMNSKDDILKLMTEMASGWGGNAWVMQFHFAVQALLVVSINAYLDSKHLCNSKMPNDVRSYGQKLAMMLLEFIPFVAWTTGGYEHMRNISSRMRREFLFHQGERPHHREVA